jgi:hypothetical protein
VVGALLNEIEFLVRQKYPQLNSMTPPPPPPGTQNYVAGLTTFSAEQEKLRSESHEYATQLSPSN